MIEVRLFATLREGREKIIFVEPETAPDGAAVLASLEIPREEVAIYLINGLHSKLDQALKDGDILAIFPPVGGG